MHRLLKLRAWSAGKLAPASGFFAKKAGLSQSTVFSDFSRTPSHSHATRGRVSWVSLVCDHLSRSCFSCSPGFAFHACGVLQVPSTHGSLMRNLLLLSVPLEVHLCFQSHVAVAVNKVPQPSCLARVSLEQQVCCGIQVWVCLNCCGRAIVFRAVLVPSVALQQIVVSISHGSNLPYETEVPPFLRCQLRWVESRLPVHFTEFRFPIVTFVASQVAQLTSTSVSCT